MRFCCFKKSGCAPLIVPVVEPEVLDTYSHVAQLNMKQPQFYQGSVWDLHIFGSIYPLVNIQKTMENHHAINGKFHYFYGHVTNSYVKLPEGRLISEVMIKHITSKGMGLPWITLRCLAHNKKNMSFHFLFISLWTWWVECG